MIVGSGIVGCYLGKLLGGQEIWEKNKAIAEKPCSSLLSKSGLDSLQIDYRDCVLNEVRGAKLCSKNEELVIARKETQAYVLDGLALQKELVREAQDSDCRIKYGKRWNGQEDEFVVGADGAVSNVARSMGIKRDYIFTYQIKARLNDRMDPDFVELYFGESAPGFFGWRIPFDERNVEIGLGVSHGNPKKHFDAFVKRFAIGKIKKVQSALIPVFDPRQKTVLGNKALVGDAAGQVKATTGGGIIFGCKCAEILAKAVERQDLNYYEKEWRKKYENDLKLHLTARKFLDKVDYDRLLRIMSEKKIHELIERHGDMDHPQMLARQLLKQPGVWLHLPKFLFDSL